MATTVRFVVVANNASPRTTSGAVMPKPVSVCHTRRGSAARAAGASSDCGSGGTGRGAGPHAAATPNSTTKTRRAFPFTIAPLRDTCAAMSYAEIKTLGDHVEATVTVR